MTDESDLKNINIFKTDIENFFESVNRDQILENINKSRILGYEPKKYIKQFFEYLKEKNLNGLPKGINLSSAFSEYFLKNFDKDMYKIPGIIYYARYVDDLILIYNKEIYEKKKDNLSDFIEINLSDFIEKKLRDIGLSIHKGDKTKEFNLQEFTTSKNQIKLDFLGYKIFSKDSKIEIGIADKKIKKIKTKIVKAFWEFEKNKNNTKDPLEKLKKSLSSMIFNFRIFQESEDDGEIKSKLYGGLSYNYMLITDAGLDDLKNLDVFFKRKLKIFKKNNKIEKQDLPYLSFLDSYLLNTLSKGNKDEKN